MIGYKIRDARIRAGLSQQELADAIGLRTIQAVGNYEAGRSLPPLSRLDQIAQVTGLPIEFFTSDSQDPSRLEIEALVLQQQRTIQQFIESRKQHDNIIEIGTEDVVMVPVVVRVSAEQDQDIEEYLPVPYRDIPAGCTPFFVRVVGNCMAQTAAIVEGDLVFVAGGLEVRDGDLVVGSVDGAAKVKRLKRMGEDLILICDDPDEPVTPASEVEIAGPVLWGRREFRRG